MTTKSIALSSAGYKYNGSGVTLTNAGVEGSSGAEHGVGIYGSNVSLINSGTIIAGGSGGSVVAFRTGTGNSFTNQANGVGNGQLRWTNGSAALPGWVFAQFHGGGAEIVLTLAGATRYPDDGKSMAAFVAA
jgi:hypothetical protein